ncbi:hypothetical protein CCO03_18100 [Comamonas serinivorans]|uniref:Type II secretion system protein K n=1 Tax=Comamonas serinivorans TaxID=1082851 RepID=A0A1Y0ERP4_9BURK|nr:type II secretion system minor pseudopilin GspK [Comamonas serinivorans]ARU06334.1 hypothetical protein CCO03_18100 [Comamonas serinivorans]
MNTNVAPHDTAAGRRVPLAPIASCQSGVNPSATRGAEPARRSDNARPGCAAQRGAALLMAMLIVALVATLASAAMWQQWRGVAVETAERTRVQSVWLLTGALDWSRLILRQDAISAQTVDHLAEPWAMPLAESRLSTFLAGTPGAGTGDDIRDAFLSGAIVDLQARMNIGNLVTGGTLSQPWQRRFARLFEVLNLPNSELDLLVQGMLAAYPKAGTTAAADAPLPPTQMDQLTWLGLSPRTIEALKPHAALVSVFQAVPVNLNTASAEVIHAVAVQDPGAGASAATGLDLAGARALVEQRDTTYFRNTAMARLALTQMGKDEGLIGDSYFGVRSDLFEVRGRLRLDDLALEEVSSVQRNGNAVSVLERRRTTVTAPAPGGLDYGSMQSRLGP